MKGGVWFMKDNVRTIGIVGTGMMASSMAVLTTGHGFHTVVLARTNESARRLVASYDRFFAELREHGFLTETQADVCKKYLQVTLVYEDMRAAETVFECVAEKVAVKQDVYRALEKACPQLKSICSVSSSIIPELLAEGLERYSDRVLVAHPFNPPHMVPYFEICAGAHTDPSVTDYVIELLRELDRKPVLLKKAAPGFIGNRLQFALWREALHIVEEGIADPRDVDACLNYSFCPRYSSIGIFEHFDNGGLELNQTVSDVLFPVLGDAKKVSNLVTDRIKAGDLGVKTGVGFYDWRNVDMKAYGERVNAPYWRYCNWKLPEE